MAADLERILQIVFKGDDQTRAAFRSLDRNFDQLSSRVQSATEPLANIGKRAAQTEAALVAMAVGGFLYAGKKAADFDSQFREITTLLDDTGTGVDQFREDILAYAQGSTKSIADINGAIYSAISAGVDYEDALGSLADAEQLAVGTKADLNSSTKTLVSTLNAYGEGSDQAARYAEILFETVKNGQTTMPELASRIANVTSIAANSGVSFEELAAAIAAITATGQPTAQAITGLRQTISNIIKPTSQATAMAEELGIEFNAQALEAKGLKGILETVKEATGGNTEQMAKLFGSVEALNSVMALTGEGAQKFADTLEQTAEHTGTLSTAYGKMADDIKLQLQNLWNNATTTLIGIGDRILASFEGVPGEMSGLFRGISEAIDTGAFDDVFDAIDDFAIGLKGSIEDIAEIAPEALAGLDFGGLIDSFRELGDEIRDVFVNLLGGDEIDLSTVEGLEAAAQRLINLFEGLTRFTKGFISGWQPVVRVIGEMAEKAGDAEGRGAELAGTISGLAGTANTVFKALDGVKAVLIGIGATTVSIGAVKGSIAALGAAAGTVATGGIAALATALVGGVVYGTKKAGDALGNFAYDLVYSAEEAGLTAEEIEKLETQIQDLKDMTADTIRMNMELTAEPWGVDDWKQIKDDTFKAFEKAGLDTSVLNFSAVTEADIDTTKADKALKETEEKARKIQDVVEWDAKIEIAEVNKQIENLKAQADVMKTSVKWNAEVDIAQAEATADILTSAFEATTETIVSTQQATNDLISEIMDADFGTPTAHLERMVDKRFKMEQESHAMQQKLMQQQYEIMEKRKEAMEEGEALINISIDESVEPALRLVMMNVLELMQTEFNEMAEQFLIGIDTVTT